ncbi:NUDIX hydrolase [Actinospica durhamensis]|uniref:NUDIX hydrolase n=1 Tax=Actinospica durhamensis TaxID=1508375 RepID=A0A941EL62_9ACTN|nr:NUDIX hydrolase [Actinospica durhamensis]
MKTISSRVVYENPWLLVREDEIERADGSPGIYSVVDKGNYAVVVPFENDGFWLVEQYRYPVGKRSWEFPMGTYPGRRTVDPLELAQRELLEETGLRAERWELLGELYCVPGFSSQGGHVYLATGLVPGEFAREPEEQDMRLAWFARADLEKMMRDGTIRDAQTIACYGFFLLHGK